MTSKSPRPMWNDFDDKPEESCREIEQQVEMRKHTKRLADCSLPEGFRLVTPHPKQFWMQGQLMWGFSIAWKGTHVEFQHVARYHQHLSDEVQLGWAMDEFTRELEAAGMKFSKTFLPPKVLTMPRLEL